jgi:hypothetical protein
MVMTVAVVMPVRVGKIAMMVVGVGHGDQL